MQSEAKTVNDYIKALPEDRRNVISELRNVLLKNLPKGFEERMSYGMPGFVVPFKTFPAGYHVDSNQPLPFINYASQKNHIGLYHLGIYSDEKILKWFQNEYPRYVKTKLDMGKSCIRFKNSKNIPFDLIGELATKISVEDWIDTYEKSIITK
jgi:uncharacterized protein YdhG (YjbR/CyaY superfamily)